jgi:hypothetical protein
MSSLKIKATGEVYIASKISDAVVQRIIKKVFDQEDLFTLYCKKYNKTIPILSDNVYGDILDESIRNK